MNWSPYLKALGFLLPLAQARLQRPPAQPQDVAHARQDDFLLQEHSLLEAKMQYAVEDLRKMELTIPLAIAAFYAWMFKDGAPVLAGARWIWFLPPLLALFGLIRHGGRQRYIEHLEDYFVVLEAHFTGAGAPGWETYYRTAPDYGRYRRVRGIFWALLVLGTLAVAAWPDFLATKP